MKSSKDITYSDIISYLNRDMESHMRSFVDKWIEESTDNEKYFQEIANIWFLTGAINNDQASTHFEQRKSAAKLDFNSRIDALSVEKKSRVIKLNPTSTIAKIAAVLILFVGISIWYTQFFSVNQQNFTTASIKSKTELLSDGSQVTLNKNTSLNFKTSPVKSHRTINLKGEAFFNVKPGEKDFVITTHDATITVLGTSFNVKSYPGTATEVYVESGKVQVKYHELTTTEIISTGELIKPDSSSASLIMQKAEEQDHLFWQEKYLNFDDGSLENVFSILEKNFETKIIVENKSILNCQITGDFNEIDLNTILKIIVKTHSLKLSITSDNVFKISGEGC